MNKVVPQKRWKDRADAGGGLIIDFMPHLIDQALCLFGKPDTASLEKAMQRPGGAAADYLIVTMRYGERRVMLSVDCFSFGSATRFRMAGSDGEYTCTGIDPQEASLRAGREPTGPDFESPPVRRSALLSPDGRETQVSMLRGNYAAFYGQFLRATRGEAEPPVSLEDAAGVVELVEALESGRWPSAPGSSAGDGEAVE